MGTNNKVIKIGSKVVYRGCFGTFPPKEAVVLGIAQSNYKRDKDGYPVNYISFADREYATFDLDDGHWCYGEQIDSVIE